MQNTSTLINGGQSLSSTFTAPGADISFCIPHELLGMIGKLTVVGQRWSAARHPTTGGLREPDQ